MVKIALTGQMRSGKDTVARRLVERYDFVKLAFADDMKRIFHELCPHIPKYPKPRAEYQRFGEEIRSLYGADIWVRHVERRVERLTDYFKAHGQTLKIVITDLRLPIEYDWCKRNGFVIVRVIADENIRRERAAFSGDKVSAADWSHETENYSKDFEVDYEIVNDGSLAELERQVDELMTKMEANN